MVAQLCYSLRYITLKLFVITDGSMSRLEKMKALFEVRVDTDLIIN